jgi:hypothetical protein
MNISDLPAYQETDIEKLKLELNIFCQQNKISRFDPEDIFELLQDGEEVIWIVQQLQQDNAALDANKLSTLLTAIHALVAPAKEVDEEFTDEKIEADKIADVAVEPPSPMDLSQLDFSQMGDQLEALTGMKLPAGINMNQVKKMMEGPQCKLMADFALWCQEQGIDISVLNDKQKVQALNERWMATPRPAFEGKTPAEITEGNPSLLSIKKVETFRREEAKVGRNDPCPCGSGKKYKKCCGKEK